MDYANRKEALREADLDEEEGADYLMVKPALCYLDVIRDLSNYSSLPIAAYNVSGEYAMLKAAAERGWIDYNKAMPEMLTSIARAGANVILTYFAKEYAQKFHSKF
jgi:porphobilinogen synthase